MDVRKRAFASYWDAVKMVVADLEITDDEVDFVFKERTRLGLTIDEVRAVHAQAFARVLDQVAEDGCIDEWEAGKLRRLQEQLSKLGWAPGVGLDARTP
jgi:hypothetical protein